jgi:predicted CoA-binding protein
MPTDHERFWTRSSYAVVGNSAVKPFPVLSYGLLKQRGSKVFAVDTSVDEIDGDKTYPDLTSLPEPVDAAVLELPREETAEWVRKAADAGISSVWIHMGRDTPEAADLAKERGLDLHTGTCAVMYVTQGFTFHSLHAWINRALGRY